MGKLIGDASETEDARWVSGERPPEEYDEVLLTVMHTRIPGKWGVMPGYWAGEYRTPQFQHAGNPEGKIPGEYEVYSWRKMPPVDPDLTRDYQERLAQKRKQKAAIEIGRRKAGEAGK